MNWVNCPPNVSAAVYYSPLTPTDQMLATKLAEQFKHGYEIAFVMLPPAVTNYAGLGSIAHLTPEIASAFGDLTQHQMKCVVMVENEVQYEVPEREGNILIKPPGWSCRKDIIPHLAFCDDFEAEKFTLFGSATLAIVIKKQGIIHSMEHVMKGLSSAISHGRLERLLVISDEKTLEDDWQTAHDIFAQHNLTVGYGRIDLPDLYH